MVNGQCDGIAGAAVDFDHVAGGRLDAKIRVIRVIDHAGNDDVLQFRAHFGDHALEQIVRQRPWRRRSRQSTIDTGRFEYADQNREGAISVDLAQVHNLLVIDLADDDPRQLHFNEHGGFFPAQRVYLAAVDHKRHVPQRV